MVEGVIWLCVPVYCPAFTSNYQMYCFPWLPISKFERANTFSLPWINDQTVKKDNLYMNQNYSYNKYFSHLLILAQSRFPACTNIFFWDTIDNLLAETPEPVWISIGFIWMLNRSKIFSLCGCALYNSMIHCKWICLLLGSMFWRNSPLNLSFPHRVKSQNHSSFVLSIKSKFKQRYEKSSQNT